MSEAPKIYTVKQLVSRYKDVLKNVVAITFYQALSKTCSETWELNNYKEIIKQQQREQVQENYGLNDYCSSKKSNTDGAVNLHDQWKRCITCLNSIVNILSDLQT